MQKYFVITAAIAILCAQPAMARDRVEWSLSIGAPMYVAPPVVYSHPRPVYVEPEIVYGAPQPVIQYGRAYYDSGRYWRGREWHTNYRRHDHEEWHHRGYHDHD